MPGALSHSPADIVKHAIMDLGLGTDPAYGLAWPITSSSELPEPDNCITVYDTEGRDDGVTQPDGERQDRQGLQVRVRSQTPVEGYQKADAIKEAFDKSTNSKRVSIDLADYTIYRISRTGNVINLGKEAPNSKRNVFTINAVITLRQNF